MQWLYLYLPQLQLDRLQALAPELQEKPFVLYDASQRQQPIVQMNAAAVKAGIEPYMPLARAWLLDANLRPHIWQPVEQKHLLKQLTAQLYTQFSDIYLDPPDGIWLDLQPMRRVYPDSIGWQHALEHCLAAWCCDYRYALHSAPAAARLLARCNESDLGRIAIEHLPCETGLKEKIIRLGLSTLSDLKSYPRGALGQKLGLGLVELLAQLEGHQRIRLSPYQPAPLFYQKLVLAAETNSWQGLQFYLKRILAELESFLRYRRCLTTQLTLRFFHREQNPTLFKVSLPHGGNTVQELMGLCQLKMESEALVAPVLELSVQANKFHQLQEQSADLWQGQKKATMPLAQLLNRLQLRMGENRVFGISTTEHWLPELAHQQTKAGFPIGMTKALYRPPWLCLHAQRIELTEWQLIGGPERVRVPWWFTENASDERDYYRALHQTKRTGWIFYCYRQQAWWLQGWFS